MPGRSMWPWVSAAFCGILTAGGIAAEPYAARPKEYPNSCDFVNAFFGQPDPLMENLTGVCPDPSKDSVQKQMFAMGVSCASGRAAAECSGDWGDCGIAGDPVVAVLKDGSGINLCRYSVTYARVEKPRSRVYEKVQTQSADDYINEWLRQEQLKRERWMKVMNTPEKDRCPLDFRFDHVGISGITKVMDRFRIYLSLAEPVAKKQELDRLLADECNRRIVQTMRTHALRSYDR